MKKIIYSLFAILTVCSIFASCGDDNEATAPSGNPATAAAGTYSGTFTRVLDKDTVTAEGTITVTATDSMYCADLKFESSTFSLSSTAVSDIAYAGSDGKTFVYNSPSSSNGLGAAFCGRIADGKATSMFTLTQRSGRKSYSYKYTFVGTKVSE
jgi:hypothetical protein